jgi:hypothetical protein
MKINKKMTLYSLYLFKTSKRQLEFRVSSIQLKPFSLRGVSPPQLPSTQSPLLPHTMCLLKHVLNCEQNLPFVIFRSGLSDIRIGGALLLSNTWNKKPVFDPQRATHLGSFVSTAVHILKRWIFVNAHTTALCVGWIYAYFYMPSVNLLLQLNLLASNSTHVF